jgi:predicted GNAT family acetyltransferase
VRPHNSIHNILWTFFSIGRFKEYRILYNSKIIAYAQIMPKIFIFAFMTKEGLHIGPCWTHPDFRGQGLFPYLLQKICKDYKDKAEGFYIFTTHDNTSSQRGIKKAGGEMFASGYKTRFGIYKVINTNKGDQ